MKKLLLIATLALAGTMSAQNLPDAPSKGKFWDRERVISNSLAYGMTTADATQTCYHLQHGYTERWNVFKGCGGIVGSMAASQVGSTLIQYWFYKKGGHWNTFGRALPWIMFVDNGIAIGYTYTH